MAVDSSKAKQPLNVVIIGGSIAGLMSGIALKHAGHNIRILEQEGDERESHMAGVCLGFDADQFLARHDRIKKPFTLFSTRIQLLNQQSKPSMFVNGQREITNWDTLYYRLRSNFDGYHSSSYPEAPRTLPSDGAAAYESHRKVLDLARDGDGRVCLTVEDSSTGKTSSIHADLVIGADGPNSFVRTKYIPASQRQYVGYIAWRGTVPERDVSEETRSTFAKRVTIFMKDRHHCLVYMIPGENGSLDPGDRLLNFLWYTNETDQSLDSILADSVDGHRHRHVVPSGRVREDVWQARLRHADEVGIPAPFREVMAKIKRPFIQVITELVSPRAAFEDGKVLLIGDGLALYRPHTAFSGTQASFHALRVEELVQGALDVQTWEDKVLRFSYLHWIQSAWWGDFYQRSWGMAGLAAARYWIACGAEKIKAWWKGEEALLRTYKSNSQPISD